MALYAATIFASAFLLFLVQPIVAKEILPWFGGSAAVWTTCLVFFQVTLLAGYFYADLAVHRLAPRRQVRLHLVLLVLSVFLLPIIPGMHWKPDGAENPLWLILGLLAVTIGLPFFLLATTSPLVQAWVARANPGASPYRLFALSNLASMLALLGYPLVLEPLAATRAQAIGWSGAYVIFALLCAAAAWRTLKVMPAPAAAMPTRIVSSTTSSPRPSVALQARWVALAATASILLLAVSNHITQDIAAVPLLWILPLAIYLLTFILAFDGSGWYPRQLFLAVLTASLGTMAWTLADANLTHVLPFQLVVFCGGLFVACMFCHGELVLLKPAPLYLTRFYLMVSIGGAVGAILVGIVAPLVLRAHFELSLGLVLCALLLMLQVRRDRALFRALAGLAVAATSVSTIVTVQRFYADTIVATRNFYGVLRVLETPAGTATHRSLVHGTILHGTQYLA
ncbi:MAG: hypothetical protein ABIS17_06410, partial [Casimicrobiaceae bacterium]